MSVRPLLLVPAIEVEVLLREINETLNMSLRFPAQATKKGFKVDFPDDGSPKPQKLGVSSSHGGYGALEKQIPVPAKDAWTHTKEGDDKSLESFRSRMEAAVSATKARTVVTNNLKRTLRVQQKESECLECKPRHMTRA